MELTSRMKMARFQTFWIQMRKNKPLDESRKTGQTSGTKMAFYSKKYCKKTYCWKLSTLDLGETLKENLLHFYFYHLNE
ncbi:hypothetical protein Hanom_Chr11g01031681 [Helianthus anomalus]